MKDTIFKLIVIWLTSLLIACGVGSITTDPEAYSSSNGSTAVITLSWTPPTRYTNGTLMDDLSGYNLYFSTTSDNLNFLVEIPPNVTSYTIENDQRILANTTYYLGMKAFSSNQLESKMSELVIINGAE